MRRSILFTVFAALAAISSGCQPSANAKPSVATPTSTPVAIQSPVVTASPTSSPTASPAKDAKKDEKTVDNKKVETKSSPLPKTTVTPEKK